LIGRRLRQGEFLSRKAAKIAKQNLPASDLVMLSGKFLFSAAGAGPIHAATNGGTARLESRATSRALPPKRVN
jgi:hypothetical protein